MLSPTAVSLLLLAASSAVHASPCIAMDTSFNLLVFGLGGKDYNAGQQDSWSGSTPATDISTTGRPPFDGANTTCYLAQFFNAVYALSADSSNPFAVYIYDVASTSWSTQTVSTPSGTPAFDPSNYQAILDHDSNVFYALSDGEMFFLDMSGSDTIANATALSWVDVGAPPFTTTGYNPVMADAQNHIHFLDVPGNSAGEADIFVIHFSFFQPATQSFPVNGGGSFPEEHGQAVSFFQPAGQGVQQEFAYIPDDGSATYVINVETNTTQSLAGPSTKDPAAIYFAGVTSLVQLDSQGSLSFLPYQQNSTSANQQAKWTNIDSVPVPSASSTASASGSRSSGTATKSSSGASGTVGAAGAGQASSPSSSGAGGRSVASVLVAAAGLFAAIALIL